MWFDMLEINSLVLSQLEKLKATLPPNYVGEALWHQQLTPDKLVRSVFARGCVDSSSCSFLEIH